MLIFIIILIHRMDLIRRLQTVKVGELLVYVSLQLSLLRHLRMKRLCQIHSEENHYVWISLGYVLLLCVHIMYVLLLSYV